MLDSFLIENRPIVFGTAFDVIDRVYPERNIVFCPFYSNAEKKLFESFFPFFNIWDMVAKFNIFNTLDKKKCILCVNNRKFPGGDCFGCLSTEDDIICFVDKLKEKETTSLSVESLSSGTLNVSVMRDGSSKVVSLVFDISQPLTIEEEE